jgi:hypothetical protein
VHEAVTAGKQADRERERERERVDEGSNRETWIRERCVREITERLAGATGKKYS